MSNQPLTVALISFIFSCPLPSSPPAFSSLANGPIPLLGVLLICHPPDLVTSYLFPLTQVSKISLVDLAGSERADSSGARGMRLKVRRLRRDRQGQCWGPCAVVSHPNLGLWLRGGEGKVDQSGRVGPHSPRSLSLSRKVPTSISL